MKKSLVMMLLVFASAALVQQAMAQAAAQPPLPASRAAQKPEIKNPAEYNAYINAIQQQNPAQKAEALEAFLQTYPNSVMKVDALELLMVSYQQAGDAQKDAGRGQSRSAGGSQQRPRPGPAGLQLPRDGVAGRSADAGQPGQGQAVRPAGTAGLAEA